MSKNELNQFFYLKKKFKLITADINFLKDCKKLKVFPKFMNIHIKISNSRTLGAIKSAQKPWLKCELNFLFSKREAIEFDIYLLHLKLTKNINSVCFENFNSIYNWKMRLINFDVHRKTNKLSKKLSALVNEKRLITPTLSNKTCFKTPLVKNLSSKSFSENEVNVLQKGLQFAAHPIKPPIENIIADIEVGISNLPFMDKDNIRSNSIKIIKKYTNNNKVIHSGTAHLYNVIKSLKQKECYYLKADKGNVTVILDKSEYFNRMGELLEKGPYEKLSKNPLKFMTTEVDNILKLCQIHISDSFWRMKLKVKNPLIPRLYGLPKIHKPGNRMREICDNTDAPTNKISKWLLNEFMTVGLVPGNSIKNTQEFILKTKNLRIEHDEIMVSFDVTALFPSIPIPTTLVFLEEWLVSKGVSADKINVYVNLTKVCMKQNMFLFNGEFYKQNYGTAMGNSLSPFLANLFMGYFEENLKENASFPKTWIRYVDDVFAIIKKDATEETLSLLNLQYPSIKFTCEKEKDGCLPFLDLVVIRSYSNRIEYDIFRKSTNSARYIPGDSFHHFTHKYAAFNCLINRLTTVPLSKDKFEKEKSLIIELAKFNKLNINIILNTIERKMKQQYVKNNTTLITSTGEDSRKKYISLTYFPPITNKLANVLKKHNLKVAYSSTKFKIKNFYGSYKDKIKDMDKSGVYKIKCKDCDAVYIGMTARSLTTRLKDHQYDIRCKNGRTALAKHVIECKHRQIDIDSMELLKETNEYKKLCVWEAIFIKKFNATAINDNNGLIDPRLIDIISTY